MSMFLWRLAIMLVTGFGAAHLGAPAWAAFLGSLIFGYLAMPISKQG